MVEDRSTDPDHCQERVSGSSCVTSGLAAQRVSPLLGEDIQECGHDEENRDAN